MRLFVDGEWDGFGGQLLSMALVPEFENGISPWYVEFEHGPIQDPWVQENVIPHLTDEKRSLADAQRSLAFYLSLESFQLVHIVADWPEDIERFCKLLIVGPGERIDIPRMTFEVVPGLNAVEEFSEVAHHAVADARAIRAAVWRAEQS